MTGTSDDAMIGRLIDGRYQITSRIARGGMATVFVATDLRLERRVAVKIMHDHLSDDTAFRARFIQEARSAARLAHPNVISVFDQGQDSEMAYIVMEYLPGITLRQLLNDYGKLTPEQTLDIMDAVLKGLAAAHKAGIVHRDLKPENVLLADDGRIKIGDFGLARATTANTASGQALLGTIAYLSPELLTRGVADARSDIYAAGIMMFEMLTGEQPYKGEQPMQVAYQHANDQVPLPSSKNPEVPAPLDDVVRWSTQRDPENRPENASQLLTALENAESGIRVGLHTSTISTQQTVVMPAHALTGLQETTVISPYGETQDLSAVDRLRGSGNGRRKRGLIALAIVVVLAILGGFTGWYFSMGPGSYVTVPAVTGQVADTAKLALQADGFSVSPSSENSATVAAGKAIGTIPAAGSHVAHGASLTLVISLGPKMLPVPKLVGLTQSAAEQAITSGSFTVGAVSQLFDAKIPLGTVIAATAADGSPLGSTYPEQGKINLSVSAGPLPNVIGKPQADAMTTLKAAGLKPVLGAPVYSSTVPSGSVVSLTYPKTGVAPGDTITVVPSKGPEMITVPNLKNYGSLDGAIAELKQLGFKWATNARESQWQFLPVVSQSPSAGTKLAKGSTVIVDGP